MTLLYSSGKIRTPTAADLWRGAIVVTLRDIDARLHRPVVDAVDVHALRRAGKQLRALALLAPPSIAALSKETRHHADTLRRALGPARDAEVRRRTFDKLGGKAGVLESGLGASLATPSLDGGPTPLPASLATAVSELALDWSYCDLADADETLAGSIVVTYARARKRGKKAQAGDTRETHRWRRSVVDLNLQLAPFTALDPRVAKAAKRAHKLRDLLGTLHDGDALIAFLGEEPGTDTAAFDALSRTAARERKHLARRIEKTAKRTFKHDAEHWGAGIATALSPKGETQTEPAPRQAD